MYCNMMRELSGANDRTKKTADYLEATVFSKDRAVIMIGNFADVNTEADRKKVTFEESVEKLRKFHSHQKFR